MAAIKNYVWQMGDDLNLSMIYKAGPVGQAEPVNLTTHSLRMDIATPDGYPPLLVLNSHDISDTDPITTGNQEDKTNEIDLTDKGEINIKVARLHTLPPAGVLYSAYEEGDTVFNYDIFLRNSDGLQRKILKGTITLEPSVTLWV